MLRPVLIPCVLAATVLALLASGVAADEGGDAWTLRTYDVSALVTPASARTAPMLGPILPNEPFPMSGRQPDLEDRAFLKVEELVELLYAATGPDAWDEEGAWLEIRGTRLEVRQRPAVVERVQAELYRLAAAARQRVLLQVEIREEDGGCRASGSVELPAGVRQALAVTSRVEYVSDYDVEIAQASNISNPLADHLDEGLAVEAVAHPLLDGRRILVEAFLQFCCFDGMRTVELGTDEECFNQPFRSGERFPMGIVELPSCSHADLHVTLLAASGEDVLVPVVSAGREATVRFHVELLDPAPPGRLLDVGALTTPAFRLYAGPPPDSEEWMPSQRCLRIHRHQQDPPRPIGSIDEIVELVHRGVSPPRWEEGDEGLDVLANGSIAVTSRPDLLADVRGFLAVREADALRPVQLDVSVLSVLDAVTRGAGQELDPELVTVLSSARLATLSGRWAAARLGTTRAYLADYDVEVAQEARIPDPQIGLGFGGLAANLRPHLPLDGRTVRVDLDLVWAMAESAPEPFDSGTQYLGPLEQIRSRRTVVDTAIGVPLDGRTLLDAGPDPRTPGARLVVAVSARIP